LTDAPSQRTQRREAAIIAAAPVRMPRDPMHLGTDSQGASPGDKFVRGTEAGSGVASAACLTDFESSAGIGASGSALAS